MWMGSERSFFPLHWAEMSNRPFAEQTFRPTPRKPNFGPSFSVGRAFPTRMALMVYKAFTLLLGTSLSHLPRSHLADSLASHSSQCAFVNLSTEAHLNHIISQSHGTLLRPNDPKCKPLVCRVRRAEDDKKSGVGAQRGGGLHKAWVEERKEVGKELEEVRKEGGGASSTETSSTDSGFLAEHFPKVSLQTEDGKEALS